MDQIGKNPSDTKMTDIKTSTGPLSEPGGSDSGPKESSIPENGGGKGSFTATSQQIRGEHHLAESAGTAGD